MTPRPSIGATHQGNGKTRFVVWAPFADRVAVRLLPHDLLPLNPPGLHDRGYHVGTFVGVEPGTLYRYCLPEGDFPDPASRFQPEGVHGPSEVVKRDFEWTDKGWRGLALSDFIFYELHVGTFSPEGTFDGILPRLEGLKELGITAVELMPLAQFPGRRNWGYDVAYPFAVQNSYGGPAGLKRLVDACHRTGLAVVLDVVWNHLGPEGNYLGRYGPYANTRYTTPWGPALNFDGPDSDEVRRYFLETAWMWFNEFHMDALRIDAVHGIADASAVPFLEELAVEKEKWAARLNRRIYLFPESDRNDSRIVRPRSRGGFAHDSLWNDDFHHALHAHLTGERDGYYADFGGLPQLLKAYRKGFVYDGQYSRHRRRRHGNPSKGLEASRFIVYAQNHDQIGNRPGGERLSVLVPWEDLKIAASAVLLSPFLPLLFMGEEYGETSPFLYFTDHSDPVLIETVRRDPLHPRDPQSEETFSLSRLRFERRAEEPHRPLYLFYKELFSLRRRLPAFQSRRWQQRRVIGRENEDVLILERHFGTSASVLILSFGRPPQRVSFEAPMGLWRKVLDSKDLRWGGEGSSAPRWLFSFGKIRIPLASRGAWAYVRVFP